MQNEMFTVRRASEKDIPVLLDFREKMYHSMDEAIDFNKIKDACETYYTNNLNGENLVAWVVEAENRIVACILATIYELPPKPENPSCKYLYIFNMFTEPQHRKKGLGTKLLKTALNYGRERGIKSFSLHAFKKAKPIFLSQGFQESNEMFFHM